MSRADEQFRNALAALNQRCFADAESLFRRFLEVRPSHVGALNLLTIVLMSMHRYGEAEPLIARALKLDQSSDVSFYNHGLILKHLGQPKEALAQFSRALRLNSAVPDTWNNRGSVRNELGDYIGALADFDRAIALKPDDPAAHVNKGRAFAGLQRFGDALAAYDKALALHANMSEAWLGRGALLALMDRYDDAFAAYRRALAANPGLAAAHAGVGNTLRERGQLDEARQAYLKAIALRPRCGEFYYQYANIGTVAADDPQFAPMEALAADEAAVPLDRLYAHFALGKAYDDTGKPDRAFAHWYNGNALKRRQVAYDEALVAAQFEAVEATFTPALIKDKTGGGHASAMPIFVLGMPRSGTTLVEQILASHPAVFGAGELNALSTVAGHRADANGESISFPQFVPALDGAALKDIGRRYLATINRLAPDANHVTDKMPGNFMLIGLIHLALPNAKIIHTVRDPVDTCLSCYANLFSGHQDYAYDLGELGRYYARYRRLMAHWRRVLPPGAMLEVRYEEIVADLEGQARRLVDYCGLPWDARCLAFNETARPVRTASASQVRQPIYGHAVERWRAYENELAPLLRELDDPAPAGAGVDRSPHRTPARQQRG